MNSDNRSFYVYVYFRLNGQPCYVGKGRGRRWLVHELKLTNPHLYAIIKASGGSLPKTKVREGLTNDEANELEVVLIKTIGREAVGGPLVNLTEGGDGTVGCNQPKSEIHKRKIAAANSGVKFTDERRRKLSEKAKARPMTQERIEHLRRASLLKRSPCSPERKAKIAAAHRGRKHSEETKVKMSVASRGKPKTAEHRAAIAAAHHRRSANG